MKTNDRRRFINHDIMGDGIHDSSKYIAFCEMSHQGAGYLYVIGKETLDEIYEEVEAIESCILWTMVIIKRMENGRRVHIKGFIRASKT